MSRVNIKSRAGDWVEVKTPEETAQTLDADGALDGLPFMPEMIGFCGKRFRVLKQAGKACVEMRPQGPLINVREFHAERCGFEGLRCDGVTHDGCQGGCLYYWKFAWLKKVGAQDPVLQPAQVPDGLLRHRLKNRAGPDRYFCQSTELVRATNLRLCVKDVWSSKVGVAAMVKMTVQLSIGK